MPGRVKGSKNTRFHRWTQEELAYLAEITPGRSHAEIRAMVNEHFSLDLTDHQVKGTLSRHHLNTGRTGRFEKGNVPPNKGRKGYHAPGSEKGWFKPGGHSHNRVPIGTERVSKDGYLEVKYRDGHGVRNWRSKQSLMWEAEHGPIPEGHCVVLVDGDKANVSLDNLLLVNRAEIVRLNKMRMSPTTREQWESALLVARMHNAIGTAKRRSKARRPK